jgi:hypothetical protein
MKRIQFFRKPPAIVIWTNKLIPSRFGGYNLGFINLIRPSSKNDKGLLYHELTHTKQFWRNPIVYCLGRWLKFFKFLPERIRNWSKRKTFEFECESYAVQLKTYQQEWNLDEEAFDHLLYQLASYLVLFYGLNEPSTKPTFRITRNEAMQCIKSKINQMSYIEYR